MDGNLDSMQGGERIDLGFENNPVHILRQELLGYKLRLTNGDKEGVETMQPELIEKIRAIGGLREFRRLLDELKNEGFDIGTLEELGLTDWSWLPEELRL